MAKEAFHNFRKIRQSRVFTAFFYNLIKCYFDFFHLSQKKEFLLNSAKIIQSFRFSYKYIDLINETN